MNSLISFVLDGRRVDLNVGRSLSLTPTTTVLNFLRGVPSHSGTKEGCAEGDCGACTVVVASVEAGRLVYRAVDSCLLFLPMLHRKQLITVENLRGPGGVLHPAQEALVRFYGSQCGFCTPGVVMSLFALYKQRPQPAASVLRTLLAGNLCRCTGYKGLLDAAQWLLTQDRSDQFSAEEERTTGLLTAIPPGSLMLSSESGSYYQPATLPEALAIRNAHPEYLVVNGASDVALRVTKRHERLVAIVDISAIDSLRTVSHENGVLRVGAGVTMNALATAVAETYPAMHSMLEVFGAQQIRNVATVGGNLGTASPVGDLLPVLIAYGASIRLESVRGGRHVPAAAFVSGYRTTVCEPDELITAVELPRPGPKTRVRSYKVSRRRDMDIATVSGGFRIDLNGEGRVEDVVLVYGGMADRTRRAEQTEKFLAGKPWDRRSVEEAMAVLDGDFSPIDDVRGSSAMRRVVARNLLLKFWSETTMAEPQEKRIR